MFDGVKEKYVRDLKSFKQEGAEWQAGYLAGGCLIEKFIHYQDKLKVAVDLTWDDIKALPKREFSFDTMILGNIDESNALLIHQKASEILFSARPSVAPPKSVIMRESKRYCLVSSCQQPNNAIEFYAQTGLQSNLEDRSLARYFWQLFHESVFDVLRTKEQLGYITMLQVRERDSIIGLRFLIQSERDPLYLEGRIRNFISMVISEQLESISDDNLKKHAKALYTVLTERKKKLSQEAKDYWEFIKVTRYTEFDSQLRDAKYIMSLSATDLRKKIQDFYGKLLDRLLIVHIWSDGLIKTDQYSDHVASAYDRIIHSVEEFPKN